MTAVGSARDKTLANTYLELHRYGQNGDYERALKAAARILHMAPQEEKALRCKVVCLIQKSKFSEALQVMQKNSELSRNFHFEKVYCLYRQNLTTDALKILDEVEELDSRMKELKAQILYRLEEFSDALNVYQDIIKNSDDEYADERETNLAAVILQLDDPEAQKKIGNLNHNTYELCYNWACCYIEKEQYTEAEKKLKQCEKLCRESSEEDGLSEEEIDIELALIRIQLAFVYQKQGRIKEAQQLYTSVLKLKLEDIATVAIASNNMVVINKDQNVFDSKKKMKAATSEALLHKLPTKQRKYIALNNAILTFYTNQMEHCIKLCRGIEENWPELGIYARVLHALCLTRSENYKKAQELLTSYSVKDNNEKLYMDLARVHLLLMQGDQQQACGVLENMGEDSHKPGIVGALITLYLGMRKKDTALKIFEKTIEWYRRNKVKEGDLSSMWRQAADFHMRNGQPKVAANSLEELIRNNPNDKKAIAQLALAYMQFDKKKSANLIERLPSLTDIPTNEDLDSLENSNWIVLKKTVNKAEPSPGTPKLDTEEKKKRKNRKHKNKLPKNCDLSVPPDPERWLPKYERTGYRKKRDRRIKEVIKGSQGTTSTQADQFDFSKNTEQDGQSSPTTSVEPSPQLKNNQKKAQQKKKNKRR